MRKAKVTLSSLFDRDIGTHLVSDGVQIRGSVPLPLDGHGMGRQCQGRREYHLYMLTAFLGRLQTDFTQGAKQSPFPHNFSRHLARARARARRTLRDFLKVKLGRKINGPFLLNEHGEPHFLKHQFKCHTFDHYISRFKEKFNSLL